MNYIIWETYLCGWQSFTKQGNNSMKDSYLHNTDASPYNSQLLS